MAESLDDAEFWLPPQFLTDDDFVFAEKPNSGAKKAGNELGFVFGSEEGLFSFDGFGLPQTGASSDRSSPVESVIGSSETESDEEDFLAGLSLRIARTTLQEGDVFTDSKANPRANLSGSPQSTLCAPLGSRFGFGNGSSRGSPNGSDSRVSSPPVPAPAQSPATWELLSAAAGEVAKIRTEEELFLNGHGYQSSEFHKQLQAAQLEHMRQQHLLKRQQQIQANRVHQMQQVRRFQSAEFHGSGKAGRTLGLPQSAWPPLQRQQQPNQSGQNARNGSGMRAVFLGNPTPENRERAGTGVFLPRQTGTQPEPRRKSACSTVLVPARVVQALNLNLEEMCGGQPHCQPRFNARFPPETDVALRLWSGNNGSNGVVSYQKRNARPHQQQQQVSHEIRLPQDWTY